MRHHTSRGPASVGIRGAQSRGRRGPTGAARRLRRRPSGRQGLFQEGVGERAEQARRRAVRGRGSVLRQTFEHLLPGGRRPVGLILPGFFLIRDERDFPILEISGARSEKFRKISLCFRRRPGYIGSLRLITKAKL